MRVLRLGSIVLLSSFIISCGQNNSTSDGTIAKIDGKVVVLSEQEVQEHCEQSFCEPNYIYHADFGSRKRKIPTQPEPINPAPPVAPPQFPLQPPIPERYGYHHSIMNVFNAWDYTEGDSEIIVAVVDTGVEVSHRDLKDAIWINEAERHGQPGVDDDGNGFVDDVYGYDFYNNRPNAYDDNKHGTHVSGIIAARVNDVGIVGVAPKVKIMPLKFLSSSGSGTTDAAIRAINYAIDNGAHIISNSWGGPNRSELLNEAIQRARAQGILVVASAGNSAQNIDSQPSYPASYSGVIAVASTDSQDSLSSFSNYGTSSVLIAAPGSSIFSTVPGSGWETLSGTSMSAPQVSGALALAKSLNQSLSESALKNLVCDTARKIHLSKVQCGRLDIGALLENIAGL